MAAKDGYVFPGFIKEDVVKFNIDHLDTHLVRDTLRRVNAKRFPKRPKINIYDDVFIVKYTYQGAFLYDNNEMKDQYCTICLLNENANPFSLRLTYGISNTEFKKIFLDFPSFMLMPADFTNVDLAARYFSLTRCCPVCDQKLRGIVIDNGTGLRFVCWHDRNHHIFHAKTTGPNQYISELRIGNPKHIARYDSSTKVYTLDGYQRNNTPHPAIYDNLVSILKKVAPFF